MKFIVTLLFTSLFFILSHPLFAQDERYTLNTETEVLQQKFALYFDTRFDLDAKVNTDGLGNTASGFRLAYLQLHLEGRFNNSFSYKFNQRFGVHDPLLLWTETEQAWLAYDINRNFSLTAGKQVVAIGGYEYDAAPIGIYFYSDFWNNVVCYQLGVSATFNSTDRNHSLMFQFLNSPFSNKILSNIWSYNLMWFGNFDWFHTIYSVNMIEYEKNKFINYIALGNRFEFGNFCLDVDWMNRAGSTKNFFKDFSIIGKFDYKIHPQWTVFLKGGYDRNNAQADIPAYNSPDFNLNSAYDRWVLPGVEYAFYGLGCEYFPLKGRENVRLHFAWYANNNSIQYQNFQLGVRWKIKAI